ncbi:lipid II flippase MurJ [Helicobacter sp. 23-1045]
MFKKAFLTNSSGILCSRVFGFLRDLSMASVLGAGIYSDIFFVAFKFPNLFRRVFSEGAFTQSFLPSFIATRKKGQFCVAIFGIFFAFLVVFSLIVCAFSGFFTKILAYGFDERTIALAKPIVAINFWYLCLIFSANFFSSLLQYKNNFWVSAYNTALLNIAMIVALFVARDKDAYTIVYFLSYGVLVGGVCQILLHCYSLYKLRFFALFRLGMRDIWRNLSLTSPSLAEDSPTFSPSIAEDSPTFSPSLAEGDKGGWLKSENISGAKFANAESTHPLAPSAREGEQNADSAIHTKSAESTSLRHCEARSAEAIQTNNNIDCHDSASQNLAMTKKMQKIAESSAKSQNLNRDSSPTAQNDKMDCHDFATQNLAMTKKMQKIAESNTESNAESTHPLTPSARGGEQNADSANRTKNAESTPFSSLRGSGEATTKQSKKNNNIDCHDSASQNLAMTKSNADSANQTQNLLQKTNAQKDIKSFFAQFFPALLGSSTAQIASFIDTLLASFLVSGSVSYLYYANRIFQLPLALFAIATSTALFPMVAKSLRNGNESQSLTLLTKGFWLLIFALSVCVVGGIMLKDEIIWLLFERGKFTRTDTIQVANVFMAYLIGLLPYGLARIFALWLYSLKRQAQAAKISAISLFCGVLCSIVLMQFFGAFGLALSSSIAGFILFALTIRAFGFAKFRKIIAKPKFFVYLIILLCVECGILFLVKTILGEFYAVV